MFPNFRSLLDNRNVRNLEIPKYVKKCVTLTCQDFPPSSHSIKCLEMSHNMKFAWCSILLPGQPLGSFLICVRFCDICENVWSSIPVVAEFRLVSLVS